MKRQKPQISMNLNSNESVLDVLINADIKECDVQGFHFFDEVVEGLNISDVEISGSVFVNCKFRNCLFEGVSFNNCIFEGCDLSFINIPQGTIMRTEIKNSKIVGINMPFSIINNVLIESTACRFANFSEGRFSYVEFVSCDMNSSSMDKCRFKQTSFKNSNLTGSNFCHTTLKSIDFRTNELNGLILLGGELDGAIVDTAQAIVLAKLLGVEVIDK